MGAGSWTTSAYDDYLTSTRRMSHEDITTDNVMEFYTAEHLDPALNPKGVQVRECCDSEEHPATIPVILGIDVTGSMGSACAAVARQLDTIMTKLYEDVKDVEFMVMGIGDFAYDDAPLQVSQFESDVRICDQLGKIWFEHGGGGNAFESYTAAWYFALRHTKLDCWERGQKGIIITLGDEPLNPYLPGHQMRNYLGEGGEDVETEVLYKEASEKFDIYHIIITDPESCGQSYLNRDLKSWGKVLDGQHLFAKNSDELPELIHDIVVSASENVSVTSNNDTVVTTTEEGIVW